MKAEIFSKIKDFVDKRAVDNFKAVEEFNKANITPVGQLQLRSNMFAEALIKAEQVERPLKQQRPSNLVAELGIKYFQNLSANTLYPVIKANMSQWLEDGVDGDVSGIVFDSVNLTPNRLLTYIEIGTELVLNPYTDLQAAIEEDMVESVWEAVQDKMFKECYNAGEATYISSEATLWTLEKAAADKKIVNPVYLVSPAAAQKLKALSRNNYPLFYNGVLGSYKAVETPYLDGEKIILGDWSRFVCAQWGGFDITVDNITKSPQGIIRLILNSYWDWGMIDSDSFVFGKTNNS